MSLVKKYKAKVVSIVNPVDNIYTVEFKSLSGKFKYLPGQFLHLALDEYDPSNGWPESRCFSMQSSPSDEFIKITFSVKGEYTIRMAQELKKDKIIDIKLPYGDLFQQEHPLVNVIFIAGGTGITPFLSFFTHNSFSEYINPRLFFGIKENKFNLYTTELDLAKQINPTFTIKILSENQYGYIDISSILKENGEYATYFISGPPSMVGAFKNFLLKYNISINSIKTDDWG
jgi:predicted ferric reductase